MMTIPAPQVRHQQLIVTIYGLYSRNLGDAMPVSVLIEMLGDLGYDAPGVRSSVSRLKAKGVLQSVRANNVAKYELSEQVMDVFHEGDQRIFAPEASNPESGWVLAIFSVPESLRKRRHQLRTELSGLGFGSVASGVWIAPATVLDQARKRLETRGFSQFVDFFRGDYLLDGPMRPKVAHWWDLTALDEQFGDFLSLYGGAVQQWSALVGEDPGDALTASTPELRREAFRYYIPMLTLWRRFPYRDPSLPLEYLPEGWKGPAARKAFLSTHRLIAPLAAAHAHELIHSGARLAAP
ncbi:PaaX family transcriptional regulator [Pseudarthrobacter sp. Y6]|uniref:PaaX family transcriptional regulator n=1 Tax=Pseudarthrobacter sp. Y6 TaxID=3418422 RepID=UPI003CF7816F